MIRRTWPVPKAVRTAPTHEVDCTPGRDLPGIRTKSPIPSMRQTRPAINQPLSTGSLKRTTRI